jgi:hypothetical protein
VGASGLVGLAGLDEGVRGWERLVGRLGLVGLVGLFGLVGLVGLFRLVGLVEIGWGRVQYSFLCRSKYTFLL